ncbi:MAG: LysM peptidoglycan-binding domain-containing protein [Burkholderiales bacterium]|nr:LysM peptidoglycan-binding domain-containing protein [Burkholderiales bacterium]
MVGCAQNPQVAGQENELSDRDIVALEPSSNNPTATSSQKSTSHEPAPVTHNLKMIREDAQKELTNLDSSETDLWTVIINGYAMPDIEGPLVRKWENWYASRPDYVERMISRSRLFLFHVTQEVKARHMPSEIVLLPMIESAYNPNAYSRSHAMGIWQFIPSTGKMYGLKQNWWIDERRDVISATDSALDYLQKLYNDFNDWHLALASYNWGEGNVSRALAKNRARNKPQTYDAIKMPAETRNYLPKLQAVKNIIRNPEQYGLTLEDIPNAPYFTVVKTTRKMDVEQAAALAEMSVEEFRDLNPQHNRPVIAGADEFSILLPIDNADIFVSKLDLTDQPLVTWQAYKVKKGETLEAIADRFNSTPEALRAVNGLGRLVSVREDVTLLVPAQQPSETTEASLSNAVFTYVPASRLSTRYRVKKGDTLSGIARKFGLSTNELMRLNKFKSPKSLRVGKTIRVARDNAHVSSQKTPRASNAANGNAETYRVKKGDTLAKISRNNGVSLSQLLKLNGFSMSTPIHPGQILKLN